MAKDNLNRVSTKVSDEMLKAFKMKVLLNDTNMSDVLHECIKNYLKDSK